MNVSAGSLDTNVLMRLLVEDIPEQHIAALNLIESSSRQFSVSDVAMVEVIFGLERHYGLSRTYISEAVNGLMSAQQIRCNREVFTRALPLFVAHPSLSIEDCSLAMYAKLNNAEPLWTFDKKLAKQVANARLVGAK